MKEQAVETGQIAMLEDKLLTLEDLLAQNYPNLFDFDPQKWKESELDLIKPGIYNDISSHYEYLGSENKARVTEAITESSVEELLGLAQVSETELSARKGLSHLADTQSRIQEWKVNQTDKLRVIQSIREAATIEVQRRARKKMLAEGGSEQLDAFVSRFLFGPPPPKKTHDSKNKPLEKEEQKKADFFLARVPSGKQMAVKELRFDIPQLYFSILGPLMKQKGLWTTGEYHYISKYLPGTVGQAVAKLYYEEGFKPSNVTTAYFQFRTYGYNQSGWWFSHSREVPTMKLTPID